VRSSSAILIKPGDATEFSVFSDEESDCGMYEYRLIGTVKNLDFTQAQGS